MKEVITHLFFSFFLIQKYRILPTSFVPISQTSGIRAKQKKYKPNFVVSKMHIFSVPFTLIITMTSDNIKCTNKSWEYFSNK